MKKKRYSIKMGSVPHGALIIDRKPGDQFEEVFAKRARKKDCSQHPHNEHFECQVRDIIHRGIDRMADDYVNPPHKRIIKLIEDAAVWEEHGKGFLMPMDRWEKIKRKKRL